MRYIVGIVGIVGIVVLLFFRFYPRKKEGFCGNCPTRNMSYDLRGEAYFPPRVLTPYMNSTIGPNNPQECMFRKSIDI